MNRTCTSLWERWCNQIDKHPDGCWEWVGYRDPNGYGRLQIGRRGQGVVLAHRLAWFFATGDDPGRRKVLHHCDNPPCCNPAHLFIGTQRDNMGDAKIKGRMAKKLTPDMVREIRMALSSGEHKSFIAWRYGVSDHAIYCIATRKSWAWLI